MLIDPPAVQPSVLSGIAAILQAVTWPAVAAWFLFAHRVRVAALLDVLERKLSSAKKVKAGPLELEENERVIQEVVDRARSQISPAESKSIDSAGESEDATKQIRDAIKDATSLDERIEEKQLSEAATRFAVRKALFGLADEYDILRARMSESSPVRTTKMNEIAAAMRALALEGSQFRAELTRSTSAGQRLAAICILQVEPRPRYFHWLVQRVESEPHAFVLFQAALAILEHVKRGFYVNPGQTRSEIENAIQKVSAFTGGTPDQNTLYVLKQALSLVR